MSDVTGQLVYHEGWAVSAACFPVLHGWVTLNGKVIDLTWRTDAGRIYGAIPPGWQYLGVPFETEMIRSRIIETEWASTVLGSYPPPSELFSSKRLTGPENAPTLGVQPMTA